MKEHHPYLFIEYARLKKAEADLEAAQAEYNKAKEDWDKLGNQHD
jgi:hypothetical protein